jgi:hypothetical protein
MVDWASHAALSLGKGIAALTDGSLCGLLPNLAGKLKAWL